MNPLQIKLDPERIKLHPVRIQLHPRPIRLPFEQIQWHCVAETVALEAPQYPAGALETSAGGRAWGTAGSVQSP